MPWKSYLTQSEWSCANGALCTYIFPSLLFLFSWWDWNPGHPFVWVQEAQEDFSWSCLALQGLTSSIPGCPLRLPSALPKISLRWELMEPSLARGKLQVCTGQEPPDPSVFFPFHVTAFPVEKQTVCGQGRFEERKLSLRWRQN